MRIRLDVAGGPLGPRAQRRVDLFRQQLGAAIPVEVHDVEEGGPAAPDRQRLAAIWDEEEGRLRVMLTFAGHKGDDEGTKVALRTLIENTMATLDDADLRDVLPDDAGDDVPIRLVIAVSEDAYGPATHEAMYRFARELDGSRVSFETDLMPRSRLTGDG